MAWIIEASSRDQEFGQPVRAQRRRVMSELLTLVGEGEMSLGTRATGTNWDGKLLTRKEFLAQLIWEMATNGRCLFPDGRELLITEPAEWLSLLKFLYGQVDGPPRPDLEDQEQKRVEPNRTPTIFLPAVQTSEENTE